MNRVSEKRCYVDHLTRGRERWSWKRARRLALGLMREHRVPGDWLFEFDRSKVRFGRCHYGRKEISLSRHLVELNDEAEVRETILHEIAHALAPWGWAWAEVAASGGSDWLRAAAMLRRRGGAAECAVQRDLPGVSAGGASASTDADSLREVCRDLIGGLCLCGRRCKGEGRQAHEGPQFPHSKYQSRKQQAFSWVRGVGSGFVWRERRE